MEKRLSVVLNKNGSIEIVPQDVYWNPQNWISVVFLLICFSLGVGLGLITLLGLRTKSCPAAIIGLQLAALLDCIQGHVLGAVFLAAKPDDHLCRLSASLSITLLMIETAEMMLLTFPLQSFQIGIIPWIVGVFIGVFILANYHNTPVNYFTSRHGCSVVNGQHGWFPMAMSFLLGSSWLGAAAGLIHGVIFRETNTDVTVSRIISVSYVILVLPTALILLISMSIKPHDDNNSEITESIFTWARYQFNILIPIVVLVFYKQVRKESENVICWCQKNSVGHSTERTMSRSLRVISRRNCFNKYPTKKSNPVTPVLFATSNGLHLRTVDNLESQIRTRTRLSCKLCDLTRNEISKTPKTDLASETKRNVRFASPVRCDVYLNESGVWSNTEDVERFHLIQVNEVKTDCVIMPVHELGLTYTKV